MAPQLPTPPCRCMHLSRGSLNPLSSRGAVLVSSSSSAYGCGFRPLSAPFSALGLCSCYCPVCASCESPRLALVVCCCVTLVLICFVQVCSLKFPWCLLLPPRGLFTVPSPFTSTSWPRLQRLILVVPFSRLRYACDSLPPAIAAARRRAHTPWLSPPWPPLHLFTLACSAFHRRKSPTDSFAVCRAYSALSLFFPAASCRSALPTSHPALPCSSCVCGRGPRSRSLFLTPFFSLSFFAFFV